MSNLIARLSSPQDQGHPQMEQFEVTSHREIEKKGGTLGSSRTRITSSIAAAAASPVSVSASASQHRATTEIEVTHSDYERSSNNNNSINNGSATATMAGTFEGNVSSPPIAGKGASMNDGAKRGSSSSSTITPKRLGARLGHMFSSSRISGSGSGDGDSNPTAASDLDGKTTNVARGGDKDKEARHTHKLPSDQTDSSGDEMDGAIHLDEIRSVAETVHSIDTIKVSNKQQLLPELSRRLLRSDAPTAPSSVVDAASKTKSNKPKKGWQRKLKQLVARKSVGSNKSVAAIPDDPDFNRDPQLSGGASVSGYPMRHRVLSEDNTWAQSSSSALPSSPPPPMSMSSRTHSFGRQHRNKSHQNTATSTRSAIKSQQRQLDLAIRGRLDGLDVLSLGSTRRASFAPKMLEPTRPCATDPVLLLKGSNSEDEKETKEDTSPAADGTNSTPKRKNKLKDNNYLDPLEISFTGIATSFTAQDIVADMIWTSSGKEEPEIVLEGYIPGGGDRWSVRLESEFIESTTATTMIKDNRSSISDSATVTTATTATAVINTATTAAESKSDCQETQSDAAERSPISVVPDNPDDDRSSIVPLNSLWDQMWGSENPPPRPGFSAPESSSSVPSFDNDMKFTDDDILTLAASCNVPIDIDEDTFIIDGPTHLRSIHDLVSIPLQRRRFDVALDIFHKLLRGLQIPNNFKFVHLIGNTHHNIATIHTCTGNYHEALKSFASAIEVREKCLPPKHPDIAVSYVRKGIAEFALERFDSALASFCKALEGISSENATKAKLLNNIGVAQFYRNNVPEALKMFTFALEIQRQWLDGPVRRESIVFDSSVTLGNMGIVYLTRADYDLAFYVYEEACLLLSTSFRKDHDIVLTSLGHLAVSKAKNKNYDKAIKIFQGILRSHQARFGPDSWQSMETIGMIGYLHIKSVDFKTALHCLRQVRTWQNDNLAENHTSRKMASDTIKAIEKCLKGSASVWV